MRKPRSSWLALTVAALLVSAAPPAALAQSSPAAVSADALDPNTLLLFSVTLQNLTLSEGMGAYGDPDDPLLPAAELTRLVEAEIDVLPAEGRIVGRLGQARRPVLLDLTARVLRVGGREFPLTSREAVVTPTEIYVRASTLSRLLDTRIVVASDELVLRLHPTEKFPVQSRLDRLASRPGGAPSGGFDVATLRVEQPYALFSPPGIDVVLEGGLGQGRRDSTFRYDLRLAGDLFWANAQGYLASDEEGRATSARLMLQRRSVEGLMLGPLHAREINLGDVYAPAMPMGPRTIAGRGFTVSTAPIEQASVFNSIDLRGELPPGFDVELYVNDVLRASTNQAINGRYEFLDLPLSPGLNVVRVVTYGPRGERLEEVQVINVGAALLRRGEAQMSFGLVEQNQPLFRLRDNGVPVIGDPRLFADHGLRAVLSVNYGLTDLVSLSAGAARIPQPRRGGLLAQPGGGLGVFSLGARTSLFGLATQVDTGWDTDGGRGASIGAAGQFGDLAAVLRHAEYRDGFVDENNLGVDARFRLQRRSELTLDSSLNLRGRIIPVSMRALRNDYAGGSHDLLAAARASTGLGQVLLSTGLEYERRALRPARMSDSLSGYISASTFRNFQWQIRTSFDYDILPDFKARFFSLVVDRRLSDTWGLRFGLGQPLDRTGDWNVTVSSIYGAPFGDLALTGEYDNSNADWRIAAQWSFGLGYDPDRGRYDVLRPGPGTGGSVLFNAFLDENGDGVRQVHEAAAPNVGLNGGLARNAVTGPDGRLLVTGLGAGPSAYLDVDLERLDNPAVSTPPTKLHLRPRPGSVTRVDFPLQPTGGVMVKVELLRDDGRRVGLASVRVQLVREGSRPVDGVTEFDGSAMLDSVPKGRWRLQLDPLQAGKLRMRLLEEPEIVISGDGDFAPDITVQVRFDPAPDTTIARAGER
ncbi:MAG: hypothetical protein U1C74_19145 [Phenylobacterium sp.]|nr:hypothetical protein [Phenylobacterium sp.]